MILRALTAVGTLAAILSGCASFGVPAGPPGACLRNATAAGLQEAAVLVKAGRVQSAADKYGNAVRDSTRVACAVLAVIVLRVDDKVVAGELTPQRAYDTASFRLDDLMAAGMQRNMTQFNFGLVFTADQGRMAEEVADKAASFARPYIPRTAEAFHVYADGWRDVIRIVERDHNIPAAPAMIALAQSSMSTFWRK